jgi:hypothetical protein
LTGVPPSSVQIEDLVGGFPKYGERGSMVLRNLPEGVPLLFSLKTRTEQGFEGCVSDLAGKLCTTVTYPLIDRPRGRIPPNIGR